jgi:small subunit ribosomal protein S2
VDVLKEKIAVREAQRLGIPVFAMVDTNSDPNGLDFIIPANDDASESIKLIIGEMCDAIAEGLGERKSEREKEVTDKKEHKTKSKRSSAKVGDSEDDEEIDDVEDDEDVEDSDEE